MTSYTAHLLAPHPRSAQAGFTLVEIMVGLTIGMLASMVVMQVFSVFEAQKRATTGAADSLTNGNIALYKIGRDLDQAAYALVPISTTDTPLLCPKPISIDPAVAAQVTDITPVTITDGGAGSDSITIRGGDSISGGSPSTILGITGNQVTVRSNFGCQLNDISLIIDGTGTLCDVSRVVAPAPVAPPAPAPPIVTPPGFVNLNAINPAAITPAAAIGGSLACLGTWHEVTYSVNAANILQRQDLGMPLAPIDPTVAGIVNMQAQYGVSLNPNSNLVVQWVDAVNGANGNWSPLMTQFNRNRIKAVRIAIVARDAKMEPANVTDPCSSTTAPAPTGLCAWDATSANPQNASPAPTINLGAVDPNWQRYRYRVFETILPIRNVIRAQPTFP
jgi:type IV pilus assembly protein PilW